MKTIIYSTAIFIALVFSVMEVSGQDKDNKIVTKKFVVKGNCNLCKDRIENAALIRGVKFVEWDKMTDTLKVIYRIDKVTLDDLHKAIAGAGHDTEKVKAKDEVYNTLPACCLYRGGNGKH